MQSRFLSKKEKLPSAAVIYAIPDKVRWDGWWLTLPTRPSPADAGLRNLSPVPLS